MSEMDIKKLLGERIRHLRKDKNISQFELAEKMGVDERQVRRIENGEGKLGTTIVIIYDVTKALDMTLKELFDF